MQRIVLCTSSSGLDYLDKPDNIRILRHHIEVYGEHYRDGEDITAQEMADAMMQDKDLLPVTSPQSVEELVEVFEGLYEEGIKEVFVVTISSKMSTTYEHLIEARDQFNGNMFIHIFDSKTVSYSEALLAIEAGNMIKEEKSSIDIVARLEKLRDNNTFFLAITDLRNLIKTKRMSAPAGFIANMFNIRPLLTIDDEGEVIPLERVRKIERTLELMCDYAVETLEEYPGELYLVNLGNTELVQQVQVMLADRGYENIPIYPTASAAIANHGPNGAGIGINHDC